MKATTTALLALTALTAVLTATDGWPRLLATLAFVLLAPGWAVTAYLPVREVSLRWTVSIALGVCVAIILAQTMVLVGWWHPVALLWALLAATAALLVHHLRRFAT